MYATESFQKVQFVDENFKPSEARDIITKVIDDQIKFYKLQNLSCWIKNCDTDQNSIDHKIAKLEERKQELCGIIKEAQSTGRSLKLSGGFDLSVE